MPEPEASDTQGQEAQPSTSSRQLLEGAGTGGKQPNTKDLKATGVARAAARLLEQDTADGGLAILSVRYTRSVFGSLLCNISLLFCLTLIDRQAITRHPGSSDQELYSSENNPSALKLFMKHDLGPPGIRCPLTWLMLLSETQHCLHVAAITVGACVSL